MTMENQPFEDLSPTKTGDFPASHVSFREGSGGAPPRLTSHQPSRNFLGLQGNSSARIPAYCMTLGRSKESRRGWVGLFTKDEICR